MDLPCDTLRAVLMRGVVAPLLLPMTLTYMIYFYMFAVAMSTLLLSPGPPDDLLETASHMTSHDPTYHLETDCLHLFGLSVKPHFDEDPHDGTVMVQKGTLSPPKKGVKIQRKTKPGGRTRDSPTSSTRTTQQDTDVMATNGATGVAALPLPPGPGQPEPMRSTSEPSSSTCARTLGSPLASTWLHRATELETRIKRIIQEAPDAHRAQLDRHLTGHVCQLLRQHVRQSRVLAHVLQPPGTTSDGVCIGTRPNDAFIQSLIDANIGMIQDLANRAGRTILRPTVWPNCAAEVFSTVPELQQLITWGLCLGEDESPPVDTDDTEEDNDEDHAGPDSDHHQPHDIEADVDLEGVDEDTTQEGDDSALVQTIMELGSSASEEAEASPHTEPGLGNEEELFTEEWVIAEVMQTLAELWDRGDETLVQALAAAFIQRGGQVPEDAGPYNLHYQLARELRPYLQRQPLHCDIPARAWQDWYDGMTNAIQVVATRIRRARWQRRANNENHGSHALPPNYNDRRMNADALCLNHEALLLLRIAVTVMLPHEVCMIATRPRPYPRPGGCSRAQAA